MKMDIKIMNPSSNIAICTLWAKKELVLKALRETQKMVNIIGTLYTVYGINYLLKTLAKHGKIDTLIVFGPDLSGSGKALITLFKEERVPKGLRLIWEWDKVKKIVNTVKMIDLRHAYGSKEGIRVLKETIKENFRHMERSVRDEEDWKLEEVKLRSFPVPLAGFYIHDGDLFYLWFKAVYLVMKYGFLKESEYGEIQKEVIGLLSVLEVYDRIKDVNNIITKFSEVMNPEGFKKHVDSLLNAKDCEKVSYTYGNRLFSNDVYGDQIKYIIDKLGERPMSRRAIATLWLPSDRESDTPPCLVLVQGLISGNYYHHITVFRSHDIFGAWPLNAYGQLILAMKIAEGLSKKLRRGIKIGDLVIFSISAHIYEHDWMRAEEFIQKYKDRVKVRFVPDLRGNIIFSEGRVEHRVESGEILNVYEENYDELKFEAGFLSADHAFWLGYEYGRKREIT